MRTFPKHYSKWKTVSPKFRKTFQERRLPANIKNITDNPQNIFLYFLTLWKYFYNLTIFRGYPWNIFETEIRGMFFEYSGNIALWLLEFAKRSTFFSSNDTFLTQKQLFHREFVKKYFPSKCSLNVPWMSGTLQRWGNTQRIFSEYCVPAGSCLDGYKWLLPHHPKNIKNNLVWIYSWEICLVKTCISKSSSAAKLTGRRPVKAYDAADDDF